MAVSDGGELTWFSTSVVDCRSLSFEDSTPGTDSSDMVGRRTANHSKYGQLFICSYVYFIRSMDSCLFIRMFIYSKYGQLFIHSYVYLFKVWTAVYPFVLVWFRCER